MADKAGVGAATEDGVWGEVHVLTRHDGGLRILGCRYGLFSVHHALTIEGGSEHPLQSDDGYARLDPWMYAVTHEESGLGVPQANRLVFDAAVWLAQRLNTLDGVDWSNTLQMSQDAKRKIKRMIAEAKRRS